MYRVICQPKFAKFCSPRILFWGGNFPKAECSCSKAWVICSRTRWTHRVSCNNSLWAMSRIAWTTCCPQTTTVWQQYQTQDLNLDDRREFGPATLPNHPHHYMCHQKHPRAPPRRVTRVVRRFFVGASIHIEVSVLTCFLAMKLIGLRGISYQTTPAVGMHIHVTCVAKQGPCLRINNVFTAFTHIVIVHTVWNSESI